MWQDVQRRTLRSTVVRSDSETQLLFVVCLLSSLNEDIPVPVVVEDASVHHVVFAVELATPSILFDEVFVGEFALRVFVEEFHVRVLRIRSGTVRAFPRSERILTVGVLSRWKWHSLSDSP